MLEEMRPKLKATATDSILEQIWDLLEGKGLFKRRLPSREASCAPHIARMIEILGPPPMDLLEEGGMTEHFFDDKGTTSRS